MNAHKPDTGARGKVIGGTVAAAILGAGALVAKWEGTRTDPYRDIVGVWGVCAGQTGVPMREYTRKECIAMLDKTVQQGMNELSSCIFKPMTVNQWMAVNSWRYNVGTSAACGSGLVRKINRGVPASQWCLELRRWVYAGGRRVQGLVNRREDELRVCLQ